MDYAKYVLVMDICTYKRHKLTRGSFALFFRSADHITSKQNKLNLKK